MKRRKNDNRELNLVHKEYLNMKKLIVHNQIEKEFMTQTKQIPKKDTEMGITNANR
jgi:hypothetical protein